MEFEHSEKVRTLQARVGAFMADHVYPNEEELFAQVDKGDRWQPVPLLEELKAKARAAELWNLFSRIRTIGPAEDARRPRRWCNGSSSSAASKSFNPAAVSPVLFSSPQGS